MEEKELTQENQEQPVDQTEPQQEEINTAENVVEDQTTEQVSDVEDAPEDVVEETPEEPEAPAEVAEEIPVAEDETPQQEKEEIKVVQEESATVMPEEVIKKLQNEPTHRRQETGSKRVLQGMVASNKGDKTIIVKIETQVAHPLYKKYYKSTKKVMAHDAKNDCNIGDVVRVQETRPLSARKRWTLTEIISRAK
jgi:small subunit ribosomal protein S17